MAANTYSTTKETVNFAHLSRLLVDICANVLREILEKRIPLVQFPQKIINQKFQLFKFLNAKQRQALFPASRCFTGTYNDFDISLLYVILRNIGLITPPTNQWGVAPDPLDRSLAANIERIHIAKNELYSHVTATSINDNLFKSTWDELELAVKEIENYCLSGQHFQNAIPALLKEPMDLNTIACYIDKIKDFGNKICETDQKVGKFEGDLQTVNQTIQTIEGEISTIDEKVTSVEAHINEGKQNRELEMTTVKGDMQNTIRKVKSLERKTDHKMRKLEKHTREEIGQMKHSFIVATTEDEQGTSKIQESKHQDDSTKQNTIDNTMGVLERHIMNTSFVPTKAVDEGLRVLQTYGILIYKGISGQGKTSNALEVMRRLYDSDNEYVLVEFSDISDWNKFVNTKMKTLVLLDDFLGYTGSDCSILTKERYIKNINSCVEMGNVKVIATARTITIDKNLKFLEKYSLFHEDHFVDISSGDFRLSFNEKIAILQRFCQTYNIQLCEEKEQENYQILDILDKKKIVYVHITTVNGFVSTDPLIGYPQTCFLYCSNRKYTRLGIAFFKHPSENLLQEMKSKRISKYQNERHQIAVLSYMFCSYGVIDVDNLNIMLMDKLLESISAQWNYRLEQIEELLFEMTEQYVVKNKPNKVYLFKHQTISDAVGLSLSRHDTGLVLEYCSWNFIEEFVRPETYQPKDDEISFFLRPGHYNLISCKAISGIENKRHCFFNTRVAGKDYLDISRIMHSKLFKDKNLLEYFYMVLQSEGKYREIQLSVIEYVIQHDDISRFKLLNAFSYTQSILGDSYSYSLERFVKLGLTYKSHNVLKWFLGHAENIIPSIQEQVDETIMQMSYIQSLIFENACEYHGNVALLELVCANKKCISKTNLKDGLLKALFSSNYEALDFLFSLDLHHSIDNSNYILNCDGHFTILNIAVEIGSHEFYTIFIHVSLEKAKGKVRKEGKSVLRLALLANLEGLYLTASDLLNMISKEAPDIKQFVQIFKPPTFSSFQMKGGGSAIFHYGNIDIYKLDVMLDSEGNSLAHYAAAHDLSDNFRLVSEKKSVIFFLQNESQLCPIHVAAFLGRKNAFSTLYQYMPKHIPTKIANNFLVLFREIHQYVTTFFSSWDYSYEFANYNNAEGGTPGQVTSKKPEILNKLCETFACFTHGNAAEYQSIMKKISE